jgi:pimeloyl-ACP methyl ester carboxylesterase
LAVAYLAPTIMPQVVLRSGIALEYEQHGPAAGEPLVLIMGLGAQLSTWPPRFVDLLGEKGFRVTLFDNRDIGLSHRFHELGNAGCCGMSWLLCYAYCCCGGCYGACAQPAPYTLEDMADDTDMLMEALNLSSAHVAGVSMGGMIAQLLTMRHPSRVRTLTSIMSTPGTRFPLPTNEALAILRTRRPDPSVSMEAYVQATLAAQQVLSGPGNTLDEEFARPHAERQGSRSFYPGTMTSVKDALGPGC